MPDGEVSHTDFGRSVAAERVAEQQRKSDVPGHRASAEKVVSAELQHAACEVQHAACCSPAPEYQNFGETTLFLCQNSKNFRCRPKNLREIFHFYFIFLS